MFTILDYSSVLEYSIIRRYTNSVYHYIMRQVMGRAPVMGLVPWTNEWLITKGTYSFIMHDIL